MVANNTADLHYNMGVALRYEDDFDGALRCFERASALDPTWQQAREQQKAVWKAVADIHSLIELKGKLKTKRFNALVEKLSSNALGPYGGGSYTGGSGTEVKLEEVGVAELKEGVNAEKVVLGTVICSVHNDNSVPL